MKTVKAYSYVRFSSNEQKKGLSKTRQTEGAETLCEENGWTLDTDLTISDLGRSAFRGDAQKGLQAFLDAIESGHVSKGSVLIVERLDRLSRAGIYKAQSLFGSILEAGVKIATLDPKRIYTKSSLNDLGELLEATMQFYLYWRESETKSQRATYNWQKKRKSDQPLTTRRPAWIDLAGDGTTFVLNAKKAEAIIMIFRMAIQGLGARQIVKELNTNNIENIASTRKGSQKHWNKRYVEAILDNRATFGEFQPMKFVYDDKKKRVADGPPRKEYYPPAISEETFFEAQKAKQLRTKKAGRPSSIDMVNIFQGICFDVATGSTMVLTNSSVQDKKRGVMRRLASYHSVDGAAKTTSWCYRSFEDLFLRCIKELGEQVALSERKTPNQLPKLEARLREVQKQITEAQTATEGKNISALVGLLTELDNKREDLERQIENEKINQSGSSVDITELTNAVLYEGKRDRATMLKYKQAVARLIDSIHVLITPVDGNRLKKFLVAQVFLKSGGVKAIFCETYKGEPMLEGFSNLCKKGYRTKSQKPEKYYQQVGSKGIADLRTYPR